MSNNQIVWTKYLTTRALLRAWYIFENNCFKHELDEIRKNNESKINRSIFGECHNALYNGLYFPNQIMEKNKALKLIKHERGFTKRATIANFMNPKEILMNIHAMYDCSKLLKSANTEEINDLKYLCYEQGCKNNLQQHNISAKNLFEDPQSLKPVQRNCYPYVKKIKNNLKLADFVPSTVYSEYNTAQKQQRFKNNLKQYQNAYNDFKIALAYHSIISESANKKVLATVDCAFYSTNLPRFGVNIHTLTEKANVHALVSNNDLIVNTFKLKKISGFLKQNSFENFENLIKKVESFTEKLRINFIDKKHTYPEASKGFLNSFAIAISKSLEIQNHNISEKEFGHNIKSELLELLNKMEEISHKLNTEIDNLSLQKISNAKNAEDIIREKEELRKQKEKFDKIDEILSK